MRKLAKQIYILLTIAILSAIYALGHWSINIRFQHPALNSLFMAIIAFSIPVLLIASACVARRRTAKTILIVLGVLSLFPAAPIGLIATLETTNIFHEGKDSSFEKVSEILQPPKALRLYVTNCGATCSYGLVLQEEQELLLGLKYTRTIWSTDRARREATLQRVSDTKVRVVQVDGITNEIIY